MRLGAPIFGKPDSPDAWVSAVQSKGYRTATAPVRSEADDATVRAYREAAEAADIVISEVGAWSNPISSDDSTRTAALTTCTDALELADRIGARCAVNISGSRGEKWDGPDPRDLTDETFDMIVETVRKIVDSVKPKHAFYTLEPMPWMYPDSPDSYLRLLKAIDRDQVGVHLDPVNMINSPDRFFRNADFLRECFRKLGPHIRSTHAKDSALGTELTVHLDEVGPGDGSLDYGVFLEELNKLDPDTPMMMEHMSSEADYDRGAAFIRSVGEAIGIPL